MLWIPFWNGCFNVGGTKEDHIPYVTKLELTYISVQGGIVYLIISVNNPLLTYLYFCSGWDCLPFS